jgi:hypothetical protein
MPWGKGHANNTVFPREGEELLGPDDSYSAWWGGDWLMGVKIG